MTAPGPKELAFKARALAQAHPLSGQALRYVNAVVGEQRTSQPLPEIGIWAGAALIEGYCLRRVQEVSHLDVKADLRGAKADCSRAGRPDELERSELERSELEAAASEIATLIRLGKAKEILYDDAEETEEALDRLIASQVSRRLEHWSDSIDEAVWLELEEYLTWWTVKGYALRSAEMSMGHWHVPSCNHGRAAAGRRLGSNDGHAAGNASS